MNYSHATPGLAMSAFTLEALAVIITGLLSLLIFCWIVTNPARNTRENKWILFLSALAIATVIIIGAVTWAAAFAAH